MLALVTDKLVDCLAHLLCDAHAVAVEPVAAVLAAHVESAQREYVIRKYQRYGWESSVNMDSARVGF